MTELDDDLDVDLHAWESPPPPDDLADAVIARMHARARGVDRRDTTGASDPTAAMAIDRHVPAVAVAIDDAVVIDRDESVTRGARTEETPREADPDVRSDGARAVDGRRRWRTRAAIAAAVVAAAAIVAVAGFASGDDEVATAGIVATSRPAHVELGGVSAAELEADTYAWWVRDGDRIVVMQQRGTATWRIAGGDRLAIDAGAAATVEATEASLRVEIANPASPLVTVAVYAGRATVGGAGETVPVIPGGTVAVHAGGAPGESLAATIDRLEARRAALAAERDALIARRADDHAIAEHDGAITLLQRRVAVLGGGPTRPPVTTVPPCDPTDLVRRGDDAIARGAAAAALALYRQALACTPDSIVMRKAYLAACRAHDVARARELFAALGSPEPLVAIARHEGFDPHALADSLDRAAIERVLAPARDRVLACSDGSFDGTVTATLTVTRDGIVGRVAITPASVAFASCMRRVLGALAFAPTTQGGVFSTRYRVAKDPSPCRDLRAIERAGDDHAAVGNYARALATYQRVASCDARVMRKAFVMACNARVARTAKQLFLQLGSPSTLVQVCLRSGIDPRATPTGTLKIQSRPAAQVMVDGVARGWTPAILEVPAGRHRLTFVVGDAKYSHTVNVEAGKTLTLHKQLP